MLEELERRGLAQNTIVLYTTDHGIVFPFAKCNLTDAGIGTAMLLRYPGNPSAGKAVDGLTSHLNVFPTLCALLDLPKPGCLQSVSLMPLLEGRTGEVRRKVFAEATYHTFYEPARAICTTRYKYIRRYDPCPRYALADIDNSLSKNLLLDNGLEQEASP